MQSENYRPLLAVACRFVPYDQWFITHLDDNQKVKQVKHWILSKCNIIQTPHLPAQRPVSPITFASSIRTRTSVDSMEDGYNEDDEYEEDSDDFDDFSYRHPELRRQTIYSRRPGKTSTAPASSHTIQPGSSPVTDQYTLISFSTGTILEDDYALSWYNLRPCELLEMHRSGKVVQLPREVISDYVQPYFQSKARALRAVWNLKSGRFESPAATRHSLSAKSKDKISNIQTPLQPEKKKRKAKVEWKDRWIVINQGTLSLCKDSSGGTPLHHFPLTSLRALRGAESLARACSIIAEQRVVCLKFQSKVFKASSITASSPPMSLPSSPTAEDWKTDVQIEATDITSLSDKTTSPSKEPPDKGDHYKNSPSSDYTPEDICRGEGEWLVLDLLDDHAFSNILRILHRYTSHPISSSFLPTSSIITVANYWNNVSSPALTPFVYSSPYDSLPYPEWRTKTVETARKAGMGDVGKPLALVLWSENTRRESSLHDIHNPRFAFSQGLRSKPSTSSFAPHSDSESGEIDGESEMEWEGWMRDLERQGSVKQHHPHHQKIMHSPSDSEHLPPSPSLLPTPPPSDASSQGSPRGHSPPHSPPAYPTINNVIHYGDPFSRTSLESRVPGRTKTTTVSTVSVGTAVHTSPRKRSSTLTPVSLSRLMKEKEKGDTVRPSTGINGSRLGALSSSSSRGTHIRHAHSGSNLRSTPTEHLHRAQDAEGSSSGKKKVGIVRGMSMRAEKLVRGLDAAIDFVDNHP
ncbi:hypothetical protein DEU56DRAFT_784992 [Suillus clintonianus]|uniref:uncharacterized protein n=1 Tax=Suillus clintonianus TaxID=1904413 RepID=UPI001B85FE06|nr:uncharacterized protein DEU56DRAFT_784992 [Suillus clintonianus]KAG2147630.1 hypothetical protein DEU56DRAFT_784992 [Suillus clintonianus]